jgi:nicotinamide riboside transporter PnuC
MTNSDRRPNSVSALRSRPRANPGARRFVLILLLLVGVLAGATAFIATDRQTRGWSAAAMVISIVGAVVSWLVGASRSLSSSDRDPQDFNIPPGAL